MAEPRWSTACAGLVHIFFTGSVELVPSLVDFRWRSTAILGGGTDSFGGSGGTGMGVSA
jgi:hypothetical protein